MRKARVQNILTEKETQLNSLVQESTDAVSLITNTISRLETVNEQIHEKSEEISTHESGGDAFVTCLDGVGKITIDGVDYELHEGESIVMPAKHPHAVFGKEQFKMLLVVVF